MEEDRVVSYDRGKQLADQLGLEFFETSAKDNVNVKQVFERLVDIICDKMSETLDSDPTIVNGQKPGTAKLTDKPPQQQDSGCACWRTSFIIINGIITSSTIYQACLQITNFSFVWK